MGILLLFLFTVNFSYVKWENMFYTAALSFNNSLFAKATLNCVRITKESALKCDAKSFKVRLMWLLKMVFPLPETAWHLAAIWKCLVIYQQITKFLVWHQIILFQKIFHAMTFLIILFFSRKTWRMSRYMHTHDKWAQFSLRGRIDVVPVH